MSAASYPSEDKQEHRLRQHGGQDEGSFLPRPYATGYYILNEQLRASSQTTLPEPSVMGTSDVNSHEYFHSKHSTSLIKHEPISEEEYARLVHENARLAQELQNEREDADVVKKALRDLAFWTYHERIRLMQEISAAKSEGAFGSQESVLVFAVNESILPERFLSRPRVEIPPADAVGLQRDHTSTNGSESEIDELAEDVGSIIDQVDALIAEEKHKLALHES